VVALSRVALNVQNDVQDTVFMALQHGCEVLSRDSEAGSSISAVPAPRTGSSV
jgi:hypothetical protein